jgi:hypothetical protein
MVPGATGRSCFSAPRLYAPTLLMQLETPINRGYMGNGVLIDEYVPLDFQQNREIIEGFDVTLHFFSGHQIDDDLDPLFSRLIQVLILNIEWCFRHTPLL